MSTFPFQNEPVGSSDPQNLSDLINYETERRNPELDQSSESHMGPHPLNDHVENIPVRLAQDFDNIFKPDNNIQNASISNGKFKNAKIVTTILTNVTLNDPILSECRIVRHVTTNELSTSTMIENIDMDAAIISNSVIQKSVIDNSTITSSIICNAKINNAVFRPPLQPLPVHDIETFSGSKNSLNHQTKVDLNLEITEINNKPAAQCTQQAGPNDTHAPAPPTQNPLQSQPFSEGITLDENICNCGHQIEGLDRPRLSIGAYTTHATDCNTPPG